ncbi:hypothetical protein Glove_346g119 [Diversispora epigaea]|uniref:Protein kinase domain-containing protein n=1 Tax=Diversispora epigaea TaxID=1348612 RepID=A0A397HEQ0_9GLOM|nr:hypothetical protein Glove_346g119 [Diversispora epigaea]
MDPNDKPLIKKNKTKNNKCSNCGIARKIFSVSQLLCRKCFALNSLIINCGNKNIDDLIKASQRSKKYNDPYLEWVPFENFTNIKKIGQGGFSQIFKATWKINIGISYEGTINRSEREVVLKILNDSPNMDAEFLNELKHTIQFKTQSFIIKCYGVTQDPQTKNYAFILEYTPHGDLHHYIYGNFEAFTWEKKTRYLDFIIKGIKKIHDMKIIHRDLHSGNILINNYHPMISDLGFSQPANIDSNLTRESQIYGIIPYMAPELFNCHPYSYASDVYSLGMIMWQLTSGHRPFHDQEHGPKLILDILDGKRPEITEDTPECWANLMKRCWHSNPSQRPTIEEFNELSTTFHYYYYHSEDYVKNNKPDKFDVWLEFKEANQTRFEMIESKKPFVKNSGYEHPNSRYYSTLLNPMLESISSRISDIFSNNNNLLSNLSNDHFDVMDTNSNQKDNFENSDYNSSAENSKKHFFDELLEEENTEDQNDFKRRRIAEYFNECFADKCTINH